MPAPKTGPRFFIDPSAIDPSGAHARCDEARLSHQVRNVLRLKEGDPVQILDGLGNIWAGKLVRTSRTYIEFSLEPSDNSGAEVQNRFNLISCVPLIKAHRFEWALEKLCELGAKKIMAFQSDRCVVKLKTQEEGRAKRWGAICKEACEQSERLTLPEMGEPLSLSDLLKSMPEGTIRMLLSERNSKAPDMVSALYNHESAETGLEVAVLTGPEGGFTDQERSLITEHGFQPVTLGDTILRSETACLSAAAVVSALNVSKH